MSAAGRGGDPGAWGPVAQIPAPQRVGGHGAPLFWLDFLFGNLTKSFQNVRGKARVVHSKGAVEREQRGVGPALVCTRPCWPGEGTDRGTGQLASRREATLRPALGWSSC